MSSVPTSAEVDAIIRVQFETTPTGIIIVDHDRRLIHANRQVANIWGVDPSSIEADGPGRVAAIAYVLEEPEEYRQLVEATAANAEAELDTTVRLRDGRTLSVVSTPVIIHPGEPPARVWQFRDITTALRAEAALREADAVLKAQFHQSPDAMLVLDDAGNVLRASHAYERRIVNGRHWLTLPFAEREAAQRELVVDKEQSDAFNARWMAEPDVRLEASFELVDGRTMEVRTTPLHTKTGERLGRLFIYRDITERRSLERQIALARHHESLAALAGGMAHKLNNHLTSILGNNWLVGMTPGLTPEATSAVASINASATAAATLVGDLRSFAGPDYPMDDNVSVNDFVRLAIEELGEDHREQLSVSLGAGLPRIRGNADSLRRAVVNLLENAFDACERIVELRTSVVEWLPRGGSWAPAEPAQGRWVMLEVLDDGHGLPGHSSERVFEPFFSTRFTGRGLGLPASLGIVREHSGFIRLHSAPGQRTSAVIVLPCGQ